MKYLIILVLLFTTTFVFGQEYGGDSHKIDNVEKKRLENQFKALGTFYIDDSGLVVYQKQETDNSAYSSQKAKSEDVKISESKSEIGNNQKEQPEVPVVVKKTVQKEPVSRTNTNASVDFYADKEPMNTGYIKKMTRIDVGSVDEKRTVKEEPKESSFTSQRDNLPASVKEEKVEDVKSPIITSKSKGNSVLNRKRASKYKTMEEAALAVEALLEELRKEQVQTTTSGSMTSKISRGVNKNLRKKSGGISNSDISNYSSNVVVKKQDRLIDDLNSNFAEEPSYFINGKQVEKIEVNKLRKKDIINKEIRVRNTVTGNPNGEVWYEVKESILQ